MTSEQKQNLDKKILEFESFVDFHSYAYENNIVFDNEEWEEYRDKFFEILISKRFKSYEESLVTTDLGGLILP